METTGGATTGYTVFVRAFLTNQKGTVYGVIKEFTIPELTIGSVTPLTARTGEQVTIVGQNFGVTADENVVTFNDVEAEIVSASATSLVVKVPSGMLAPTYNEENSIVVITGGQTITATRKLSPVPTVTEFSPKDGKFGTTLLSRAATLSFFHVWYNWRKARSCTGGNRHVCDICGPVLSDLSYPQGETCQRIYHDRCPRRFFSNTSDNYFRVPVDRAGAHCYHKRNRI